MKRAMLIMMAMCLLLTGCSAGSDTATGATADASTSQSAAVVVQPLPDTTMDELNDAILAVSLEKGDVYVDDTGKLQMDVKIYAYDKYDMVDIATLKVGDSLLTHDGEVTVNALERDEDGTVHINGGLAEDGFDLVTNESGVFFEVGYNDLLNWYQVGEATLRVSADFEGRDNADLDKGEVVFYPGSFLNEEVKDYYFVPSNTTIRVENGQVVELTRIFVP